MFLTKDWSVKLSFDQLLLNTHTLFRNALNKSRTRLPSYFLNLPRSLETTRSIRLYQSTPITVGALVSSFCSKGEGGSRSSISNLSEASCKKASLFVVVQKKGCDKIVSAVGLLKSTTLSKAHTYNNNLMIIYLDLGSEDIILSTKSLASTPSSPIESNLSKS